MRNVVLVLFLFAISSCSFFVAEVKNIHRGYFSYFADAAMFVDCVTNEKYPVATEGDYLTLEKEYLQVVKNGGEKILIEVNGKIIKKDKVEGEGKRNFLIIEKFLNIFPNKKCN
ncbi:MAG: hypothetical protein GY936_01945 [Ignavibacteriae bacterium]|nr:hypothetical protein [Ignavibacteriota bacterium]